MNSFNCMWQSHQWTIIPNHTNMLSIRHKNHYKLTCSLYGLQPNWSNLFKHFQSVYVKQCEKYWERIMCGGKWNEIHKDENFWHARIDNSHDWMRAWWDKWLPRNFIYYIAVLGRNFNYSFYFYHTDTEYTNTK